MSQACLQEHQFCNKGRQCNEFLINEVSSSLLSLTDLPEHVQFTTFVILGLLLWTVHYYGQYRIQYVLQ